MKKFYSLLIAILVTVAAMSQTTYTWQGANNGSWATSTNWTPTRTTPANNDILQFNDGSTKNVTGVPTQTVGRVVVTASTTVTLQAAAGVTITLANGTGTDFQIDAGSQLTMGTNINVTLANNATATVDGTLTVTTGRTYNTNGGGAVNTTVSGTIENSGTVTCTNTGKLSFLSGATYIHAEDGGTVPTATWNAGSLLDVTGITGTALSGLNQAFSDITWECTNQTLADMRFNEMTAVRNLKIVSTGTGSIRVYSTGATASIPTTGNMNDFEITGGTLNLSIANGIGALNVAGDFTISGGTISETSTGSGAVNFNGTLVQTFSKTGGTISNTVNFTIVNSAAVDFGTSVLDGSTGTFTLSAGGKIITANSNGLSATGSVQITRSYNSGADYEFQGTSTGTFTTTPTASTVRNLTVNNSTGDVTLAQPMAVTGTLNLTNGLLNTTATNLLTINDNATTSGAIAGSFVNGPMAKVGNDAFTFPVGKSGAGFRTIGISAPVSTTQVFTAEFFRLDPHSLSSAIGAGIIQISGCEYWTLDRSVNTNNVSVILSWESVSPCSGAAYVGNMSTLREARLSAGTWVNEGRLSTTGTNTAGTITSGAAVTTFNTAFALSTSAADNPLPVMFADVRAYEKNNGVEIDWSNLTERDLVNYVVERSANGQDFVTINQQLPRSNRNDKESYSAFDASPLSSNYYRIKVFEISGKIIYSKILKVDIGGKQPGFTLYPNPVSGGQVSVSLSAKQGQYTLKVLNNAGQEVYSQRLTLTGGSMTQTVVLPSSVKPGAYNMMISGDNYRESKMFIVQ